MKTEKFNKVAYNAAYNAANYARIELKIPKALKAEWEQKAKTEGMSLTAWIKKKIEQ